MKNKIIKIISILGGYLLYFGILLIINDVLIFRILKIKSFLIYSIGIILFICIGIILLKNKIISIVYHK